MALLQIQKLQQQFKLQSILHIALIFPLAFIE